MHPQFVFSRSSHAPNDVSSMTSCRGGFNFVTSSYHHMASVARTWFSILLSLQRYGFISRHGISKNQVNGWSVASHQTKGKTRKKEKGFRQRTRYY
jgi:hypothetical protein